MVEEKKEEEAMQAAWDNYEYSDSTLHSTTFAHAFELGLNWHKEQMEEMMYTIYSKEQEVLLSAIRFNGVHINTLMQIFEKYGIKEESPF